MQTVKEARSEIETAIILAMSAKASGTGKKEKIEKHKKGWSKVSFGIDGFVTDKDRRPKSFYAYDAVSAYDRLYTACANDLVVNVYSVARLGVEVGLLLDGGSLKWTAIHPMAKPKGITAITNKTHSWFACHYRHIHSNKEDEYVKQPVAICNDGSIPLMNIVGRQSGFNSKEYREDMEEQVCIVMSVFEDAIRSSAYLATVQEDVKMMFPVGEEAYKDFFRMRDGYRGTPTGRKNPIVHWCSQHLRKRGKDGVSLISAHKRGASEFVCGPMKLTIQENDGYSGYA